MEESGGLLWYLSKLVRAGDGAARVPMISRVPDGWDRRRFFGVTGAAAGVAVLAAASSRRLESDRLQEIRDAAPDSLPPVQAQPGLGAVDSAAPAIPADAQLSPDTPYLTPNDDFYLIDTALSVPRIDVADWSVEIRGLVDRPMSFTYADLLARPQVERVITICCV